MGGAKRYPSRLIRKCCTMMGFAALYPSYGLRLRRYGADQRRIPAPQIIVGQVRAAPPAVDRIVAAEIFLVRDNGLAELGERQPASQVGRVAIPSGSPARVCAVPRQGPPRPVSGRTPARRADSRFPIRRRRASGADCTADGTARLVSEYPRAISSSIRISVAPSPVDAGGQFFEQFDQGRSQQRQGAQIPGEQIEAGFRRRRPICLPGRACRSQVPLR